MSTLLDFISVYINLFVLYYKSVSLSEDFGACDNTGPVLESKKICLYIVGY